MVANIIACSPVKPENSLFEENPIDERCLHVYHMRIKKLPKRIMSYNCRHDIRANSWLKWGNQPFFRIHIIYHTETAMPDTSVIIRPITTADLHCEHTLWLFTPLIYLDYDLLHHNVVRAHYTALFKLITGSQTVSVGNIACWW